MTVLGCESSVELQGPAQVGEFRDHGAGDSIHSDEQQTPTQSQQMVFVT